ncbi:MAG: hypothetical protein ACOYU5_11725 [Stygiobacter sp.]
MKKNITKMNDACGDSTEKMYMQHEQHKYSGMKNKKSEKAESIVR